MVQGYFPLQYSLDKHSSLFRTSINYGSIFSNIGPCLQCLKPFFSSSLTDRPDHLAIVPFQPSLLFANKARSLALKWSPTRCSTQVGSTLRCKYQTRVEVTESDKHFSLPWYGINYGHVKFDSKYRWCQYHYAFSSMTLLINKLECLALVIYFWLV